MNLIKIVKKDKKNISNIRKIVEINTKQEGSRGHIPTIHI